MAGPINYLDRTGRTGGASQINNQPGGKVISPNELAFGQILSRQFEKKTSGDLQFSKHAAARVEQRGIELTKSLLDGLQEAVEKARDKGAKDVVVIGQQGAFIVNVPNNTVVTTMAPGEMRDNIFTNIDSAVIM